MSKRLSDMDDFRIMETGSIPSKAAMINGLPDVGLVGLLAASHIISSLNLDEVGSIECDSLPPMIVLHHGLPKSPIRIFAGNSLVVVISETAIPSSLLRPLSNSLVDWAHSKTARLVLSLGGMAVANRQDIDAPKVFAALSDAALESKLNGAARLSRPVPEAVSNHPRFMASSFNISPGKGPVPTRVINDFRTTRTLSTFVGPTPASEQIAEAPVSLPVTYGYVP